MKQVYVLVVNCGRVAGDGLPAESTGVAMLILAPAAEEKLAVSDTVRLLKDAGLSPLEVDVQGTTDEMEADGNAFSEEQKSLIAEALSENNTIILDKTVLFGSDDHGVRN